MARDANCLRQRQFGYGVFWTVEQNKLDFWSVNLEQELRMAECTKEEANGDNVWLHYNWDGFVVWNLSQIWIGTTGVAGPKTENSFWPANFVFVQLRHFFSLKISQFWNFQTLQDEIGNSF